MKRIDSIRKKIEDAVSLAETTQIEKAQTLFAEADAMLKDALLPPEERHELVSWMDEQKQYLNTRYAAEGYAEERLEEHVGYDAPETYIQKDGWSYPVAKFPEKGTVIYPYRRRKSKGRELESYYCRLLKALMPAQLHMMHDVSIHVSEQKALQPDMALVVEGHPDIRIDVEIDEPYSRAHKPIHYISCGDDYRDALLNRLGWIVVRFTSEQVIHSASCCADYLLALVQSVVGDSDAPSCPALYTVERWTMNEALMQAAKSKDRATSKSLSPDGLHRMSLTPFERTSYSLVNRLPRSADMQAKMTGFTDAGRYEQDQYIDFEPNEHIYIYDGREQLLPVSSLIAYFFEAFDALQSAQLRWERYQEPVEVSLEKWNRIGKLASEVGTFVHAQTENYFRNGTFETVCPFFYNGQTEEISVEKELQHFLHFVEDYNIKPYRQEWPVYDTDLNIAGTIDLVCKDADGSFVIYDWKRSNKVVNSQGQPIVEGFNGRMSFNGIHLPDTPYYHYCIQQNLYRYMLETHYGIKVKSLNLVILSPDYPTYYVASVPIMDEIVSKIVGVCQKNDLGHRLLKNQ